MFQPIRLRRLIIDSIRSDPDWKGGDHTVQPRSAQFASVFYGIATNGGTLATQKAAPTRDYNPAPKLDRIQAALLAINAADDERNPPETGLMVKALERVKGGRLFLIPASDATSGHGTTGQARWYGAPLRELLQTAPRR